MISTTLASLLLLAAPQDPSAQPMTPVTSADQAAADESQSRNLDLVANAEMLPGDSLAIVSMAPIGPHRVELMKTGLDDLLRLVGPSWNTSRLLSWIDLVPVDAASLTSSGFSLAISDVDVAGASTRLRWILIAPTTHAAELRGALKELHKQQKSSGFTLAAKAIDEHQAWSVRSPKGESVSYMITGDALLIGDSFASIHGAFDQLDDVDSSLAASRPYLRYARKCAREGQPFLTLLVQPQPMLDWAVRLLPNAKARAALREIAKRLELHRISEFGTSLFAKDGQIRDFTWLGYPSPRTGLLASLVESGAYVRIDQLKTIAPNALSVALFTFDLETVYAEVMNLTQFLHPSVAAFARSALAKIEPPTGLSVPKDILPMFGSSGEFQEWLPEGHRRARSLTVALKDSNAMRALLNKLARALELESVRIGSIPVLVLPGGMNSDSSTLMTVHGNTLILGSTPRSLKNVVTMLEAETTVQGHRLARLIGNSATPQFFMWGDCASISRDWLHTLRTHAGYRSIARELGHAVRARGGSVVWSIETDTDGIASRSQSPFGNLYVTLALAYALKMTEFEGDTATQLVNRRRAIIRDLITAEHEYRSRVYKDMDGDHLGEFGSIEELAARGLITRRWFAHTKDEAPTAAGYRFAVFTPNSRDGREDDFLLLAWPTRRSSGDAFAATALGTIYRSEILGQTANLESCDPRDFYARGNFDADILPGWDLVETSMVSIPNVDTVAENREFTAAEKTALDALSAAEGSGTITPKIVALLNSPSAFVVARTAFLLGNLKHKNAVPPLCDTVRGHPNTAVKRQAMAALCKIRDPRSIQASIEALSSTDSDVRTLAAQNLGYVHGTAAASRLLDVLAMDPNPDAPDRIAALLALADLGQPGCLIPSAARVKALGKQDEKALVYLFQTLSRKLPPQSEAETLMAVLDDDSELLRRFAIQRLGILELSIASPALRARLDKETSLRALIDVSLKTIAGAQTSTRIKGYVNNAAAQGRELWNTLPARFAYGIGAGLILTVILWRRVRRRRQFTRDGDRVVAMIAPSAGFQHEADADYDDDLGDEFEEGNEFAEDDTDLDDDLAPDESADYIDEFQTEGPADRQPAHGAAPDDFDAGYYGEEDKDCYYSDDPLDEFLVDDEIISTD